MDKVTLTNLRQDLIELANEHVDARLLSDASLEDIAAHMRPLFANLEKKAEDQASKVSELEDEVSYLERELEVVRAERGKR